MMTTSTRNKKKIRSISYRPSHPALVPVQPSSIPYSTYVPYGHGRGRMTRRGRMSRHDREVECDDKMRRIFRDSSYLSLNFFFILSSHSRSLHLTTFGS